MPGRALLQQTLSNETGSLFTGSNATPQRIKLIPEGDAHGAAGLDHLAVGRHELEPMNGFGDRNAEHLIILIADHLAELLCSDEFDSADAETGAEDPVQGGRGATALQMSEDAGARFLVRAGRDLRGNPAGGRWNGNLRFIRLRSWGSVFSLVGCR